MNFLQTYNADENVEAMKLEKNETDNEKDNEEVRFAKSFIKTKNIIKTDLINLRNQKNLRGIISFSSLSVTPLRTKKPDIVKKIFADFALKIYNLYRENSRNLQPSILNPKP